MDVQNGNDIQAEANFSAADLQGSSAQADDGFLYSPIRPETYARGFDAAVRVRQAGALDLDGSDAVTLSCNVVWNKMFGEDGVVPLDTVWYGNRSQPFTLHSCPLVTMVYTIPDMVELRQIVNARQTQNKCQENKNRNWAGKLVEEAEDFDDVHFVPDVTDVTENAPRALLRFLRWLVETHDFDHLLITNDEAFLAVDAVASRLRPEMGAPPDRFWRSSFRRFVPVRHAGALDAPEVRYRAGHYPAMPSESGSVLSRDLVKYLADNADALAPFGGVSASLAVWLAPLAPELYEDDFWAADNVTCSPHTLAIGPMHERKRFKQLWDNYRACGKPCSC